MGAEVSAVSWEAVAVAGGEDAIVGSTTTAGASAAVTWAEGWEVLTEAQDRVTLTEARDYEVAARE